MQCYFLKLLVDYAVHVTQGCKIHTGLEDRTPPDTTAHGGQLMRTCKHKIPHTTLAACTGLHTAGLDPCRVHSVMSYVMAQEQALGWGYLWTPFM